MAWLEAPISDGAMAFLMPSMSRAAGRAGACERGQKVSANLSILPPERRVIAAHGPRGAFFWERIRARRRGRPGRCSRGAAGAICVAILAFALPGGEALKYTDAGARANHAADRASEGGDGSDESDNPHVGRDLAV